MRDACPRTAGVGYHWPPAWRSSTPSPHGRVSRSGSSGPTTCWPAAENSRACCPKSLRRNAPSSWESASTSPSAATRSPRPTRRRWPNSVSRTPTGIASSSTCLGHLGDRISMWHSDGGAGVGLAADYRATLPHTRHPRARDSPRLLRDRRRGRRRRCEGAAVHRPRRRDDRGVRRGRETPATRYLIGLLRRALLVGRKV